MATVAVRDAHTPLVLTIDVGTSSARAVIYDAHARAVEGYTAQTAHDMDTTADGGVFCDADALIERIASVIDDILKIVGDRAADIAGVAVDTFWHNVVGVGTDGTAITPLYTWADTRSADAATKLRQRVDEHAVHDRTGCMIHPMYLPAKFLWLAETEPEIFGRATYWMSLAEYLTFRVSGTRACSLSMASGSGLLNLNENRWDTALLAVLPVREEQLSPLVDVDAPVHGLTPVYAARWPALVTVPWYPALGDGAASNVGSGGVDARRIAVNAGTSTAMRLVQASETVAVPDGLWAYRVDRTHFVVGGAESNGGNVWAWIESKLRADDGLLDALAMVPPDGHGLTVLPFLAGERSPNYNAYARGAVTGISLDTTVPEIARAMLEAITYRLVLMHRIIAAAYPEAREIIISGAALLHNPLWMQMLADALGCPITVSDEAEATSRGAALIALEQLGAITAWDVHPIETGRTLLPDMETHTIYARAIERQEQLYRAVVPTR